MRSSSNFKIIRPLKNNKDQTPFYNKSLVAMHIVLIVQDLRSWVETRQPDYDIIQVTLT